MTDIDIRNGIKVKTTRHEATIEGAQSFTVDTVDLHMQDRVHVCIKKFYDRVGTKYTDPFNSVDVFTFDRDIEIECRVDDDGDYNIKLGNDVQLFMTEQQVKDMIGAIMPSFKDALAAPAPTGTLKFTGEAEPAF